MSIANDCTGEFLNNKLSPEKIRTVSIAQCLPFLKKIIPESDTLYTTIVSSLCDLSLIIGIDKRDRIFTSDNPVFCRGSDLDNIEQIIFPLSSDMVLFLVDNSYCNTFGKILFYEIKNADIEEINWSIARVAKSCILSKYFLMNPKLIK